MKHLRPFALSHIQVIVIFFICCLFLLGTSVIDAKIVFRIGPDIYVMEDDGTNRRRLTKNTETQDSYPRWSPDGKKITFIRKMNKKKSQTSGELFIMNANGKNLQRLTDDNVSDNYPSWSPDGTKIAFRSHRSGRSEVHVIDLATRNVTQLTGLIDDEGEFGSTAPDWSPDGTQIVYEKFIDLDKNIYVMSANGEDQRPLLPDPDPDDVPMMRFFPRWSADGQRILFDDCTWLNGEQLCRLTIAALSRRTHEIKIHDKLGKALLVGTACWMHNDKALLLGIKLLDEPKANYDIYRYDLNTGSLKRLTHGEANEGNADWIEGPLSVSPQGKKKVKWGTLKK